MRSSAIIGFTGKGLYNKPTKIDNVKDLHTNFGKKSNLTSTAEHLLYADHNPIIVRVEDESATALAYLLDENDTICMIVSAESPGFSGELTTVEIVRNPDFFSLIVLNSGEMVEFWGNLKPNQAEEIINFASRWITISVLKDTWPKAGIKEFCTEQKKISNIKLETILNAIKSTEDLDIEFISIPDCDSSEVINDVLWYLETERSSTILVIDPPWEFDLLQTYKWCKKIVPSDHGVIFWPWLNYDRRSIPSSGPILAAILSWPFVWKPIRTRLAGISDTAFSIHYDELAYLSKHDHFINLINKKNDSLVLDTHIFTLAGNKLSERRLLNYIEAKIIKVGTELLSAYNPISNNFRNNFIESSEYILQQVKDDQGINNYVLRINELTNPENFEVNIEVAIKNGVEIVNICFKFTQ